MKSFMVILMSTLIPISVSLKAGKEVHVHREEVIVKKADNELYMRAMHWLSSAEDDPIMSLVNPEEGKIIISSSLPVLHASQKKLPFTLEIFVKNGNYSYTLNTLNGTLRFDKDEQLMINDELNNIVDSLNESMCQ